MPLEFLSKIGFDWLNGWEPFASTIFVDPPVVFVMYRVFRRLVARLEREIDDLKKKIDPSPTERDSSE